MASQNSIIAYAPQPYFVATSSSGCYFEQGINAPTIANEEGLFNPDLSNYATISFAQQTAGFVLHFDKLDNHLTDYQLTTGLIGCSLLTYEDDGGNPDLATEFPEDIFLYCGETAGTFTAYPFEQASYVHNFQNSIKTFCAAPLPGIISGGRVNVIFPNVGTPAGNDGSAAIDFTIMRRASDFAARPHAALIVGHLFVGVQMALTLDPRAFAWSLGVQNNRATARDLGTISSEGTLVRESSGEIIKIAHNDIAGAQVTSFLTGIPDDVLFTANFFDLTKVTNSYPLLFNPYPYAMDFNAQTVDGANLTARQNFFSIYGFMDGPLEFQVGEYRDGLDSEYRARFRIKETR